MESRITLRHFRCDAHPGISTLEPDRRVGRRTSKMSAYSKRKGEAKCKCGRMFFVDAMVNGSLCLECSIRENK